MLEVQLRRVDRFVAVPVNYYDPTGLLQADPSTDINSGQCLAIYVDGVFWGCIGGGGSGAGAAGGGGPVCALQNLGFLPNIDPSCYNSPSAGSGAGSDECDEIKEKISNTINGVGMPGGKSLLKRIIENITGDPAKYVQHDKEIQGLRRRLQHLKNEWNDNNCPDPGNPPFGTNDWISAMDPRKLKQYQEKYQQFVDVMHNLATAGRNIGALVATAAGLFASIEGFFGSLPVVVFP